MNIMEEIFEIRSCIEILANNIKVNTIDPWASEQILNGTSAQLGHTVPFTLDHDGKYRTEDKLKHRQYTN